MFYKNLNPQKALIWRITHRNNLPWLLDNGLHCGTSTVRSSDWVDIGNPELIDKRGNHPVPDKPGGVLNDYVPFYFTPFSVMMQNIHTGWSVPKRDNDEIVILVSSLYRIRELELPFLFTDSHAYYMWANFYSGLADLDKVDWSILQRRDFKRDQDDPAKFERYQAEALVYRHVPVEALLGVVCYTEELKLQIDQLMQQRGLGLSVYVRTGWYFQ
ncbi:type II toxin-antitoxin system toxin DNA ADP-ribosyl transferase DarT [Endozoicomonas euniceicola]|uniref:DUF4433 domain-containing protein n=1 Tax=Endozoicomonas euniceicola TaxID=1234143 RepID=A0ABY6GWE5_9GAMM|nr:DUF4433 domain-containing protein [Endozoicomonas euniceicola]UYM17091.1 DUF4433 domain-containing protein [Endozoicomonas euniceicola]